MALFLDGKYVDLSYDYLVGRVLTRIPINDKATRDIEIDVDTTLQDFVSRMCANMGLDPNVTEIGWKSNDDLKRTAPRELRTEDDLKNAFCDLLKLKNNRRRTKEVFMQIFHLVSYLWYFESYVLRSFIRLRILCQLKLQRRRVMEIELQTLPIMTNCELCRRSFDAPNIQVQTAGVMSARRILRTTLSWDWRW